MANRIKDRYMLPECVREARDITRWVAGMPFFFGSTVKYVWRGWKERDDLEKALLSLRKSYRLEACHIHDLKRTNTSGHIAFVHEFSWDVRLLLTRQSQHEIARECLETLRVLSDVFRDNVVGIDGIREKMGEAEDRISQRSADLHVRDPKSWTLP